jgi:hypothetical protein
MQMNPHCKSTESKVMYITIGAPCSQKYLLKQQARSSLIDKTSFDPKRYGKTCLLDRRATGKISSQSTNTP